MQVASKLTALTAFLTPAAALALDSRATTPSIVVTSYALSGCTETDSLGNKVPSVNTVVVENNVTALPTTISLQASVRNPCLLEDIIEMTIDPSVSIPEYKNALKEFRCIELGVQATEDFSVSFKCVPA